MTYEQLLKSRPDVVRRVVEAASRLVEIEDLRSAARKQFPRCSVALEKQRCSPCYLYEPAKPELWCDNCMIHEELRTVQHRLARESANAYRRLARAAGKAQPERAK